jgi:putative nucleotidyltransferase with HDIG domain
MLTAAPDGARLIRHVLSDPALALAVLRRGGPSVAAAVESVGEGLLPWLALSARVWGPKSPLIAQLGRHSLAVACIARSIAARLSLDADEAYLAGLLHDVGKLALIEAVPKSWARATSQSKRLQCDLATCERRVIGMDHLTAGRRVAQSAGLPERIEHAIWLHHQPPGQHAQPPLAGGLSDVVALADALARRNQAGYSGNFAAPDVTAPAEALGIAQAALGELVPQALSEAQTLADEAGLGGPHDETAYHAALARAAGACADQWQAMQRKLVAASTPLAALGSIRALAGELSGRSTVAQAVEPIARALAHLLGAPPLVAVYSGGDAVGEGLALTLRFGAQSSWQVFPLQHLDRAQQPLHPAPAGQALQTISTSWLDSADVEGLVHRPLLCQGQWVGGIIVPSAPAGIEEVLSAFESAVGPMLAIVQGRARAMAISEQLAGASQSLARTQQALAQARTLAAVVEMAAGAAHELNNPLAVISGRAQLMERRGATDEDRKVWRLMIEQSQRMSDIVTDLMNYANPRQPAPVEVSVGELLRKSSDEFLARLAQATPAVVDIQVAEPSPPVWCDSAQMTDVFVELLSNAARAAGADARVTLAAQTDEDGVTVSVTDNGPGMDDATKEAAFTPFFSSQPAGRRRGLGLSLARRLVELNGGRMWLVSSVGNGTTVYVQLPQPP